MISFIFVIFFSILVVVECRPYIILAGDHFGDGNERPLFDSIWAWLNKYSGNSNLLSIGFLPRN
jgi:hypothetical protein